MKVPSIGSRKPPPVLASAEVVSPTIGLVKMVSKLMNFRPWTSMKMTIDPAIAQSRSPANQAAARPRRSSSDQGTISSSVRSGLSRRGRLGRGSFESRPFPPPFAAGFGFAVAGALISAKACSGAAGA